MNLDELAEGQAAGHVVLSERGPEARRLADAVRRLITLAVSNDAPADVTNDVAARLEAVAALLEPHEKDFARFEVLPDARPPMATESFDGPPPLGTYMPFDPVVGVYNPLALPITLEFEPTKAIARGRFTRPYEGAPGCVHGAVLAAVFDIVLTAANALVDATGPTVRLAIRYRRPTLLAEEAVFEGWVTERTDRRVHSLGRIVQAGVVTVEAEGEFAIFDAMDVAKMARKRKDAVAEAGGDVPVVPGEVD
jgi:acyl-CoA thioesterase FadM